MHHEGVLRRTMPAERSNPSLHDVRMRGFARRTRVEEATAWVEGQIKRLGSERVSVWAGGAVSAAAPPLAASSGGTRPTATSLSASSRFVMRTPRKVCESPAGMRGREHTNSGILADKSATLWTWAR